MLLCPGCRSEYEAGTQFCPDCNLELIDVDLITCQNCGESIESLYKYCHHCGLILRDSKSEIDDECENHPGRTAVGICSVCGKPVCEECARHSQNRIFCEKDEHLKLYGDYALIATCATEYEAQTIKSLIEMTGIPCVLFSQKDHVFFVNIGDTAIVHVMVPKEDADKAVEIIEKMNSEEGDQEKENENE